MRACHAAPLDGWKGDRPGKGKLERSSSDDGIDIKKESWEFFFKASFSVKMIDKVLLSYVVKNLTSSKKLQAYTG